MPRALHPAAGSRAHLHSVGSSHAGARRCQCSPHKQSVFAVCRDVCAQQWRLRPKTRHHSRHSINPLIRRVHHHCSTTAKDKTPQPALTCNARECCPGEATCPEAVPAIVMTAPHCPHTLLTHCSSASECGRVCECVWVGGGAGQCQFICSSACAPLMTHHTHGMRDSRHSCLRLLLAASLPA